MAQAANEQPWLIKVESVSKSFGVVRAIRDVSIEFRPGEVHGMVGANGAGKSTLLNMLSGNVRPDTGSISVDGAPVTIENSRQSAALGFAFIYQELALVPEFSAIDNLTLGQPAATLFGMGDKRRRRATARRVADRLRMDFSLDRPVRELTIAERGLVAIGRALVTDARFVAMDEPTASLSQVECKRLFAIIAELAQQGVAIAYVSHRLDEISELCDTVTVFKDGQSTARYIRGGYTRGDLILGITGTSTLSYAPEPAPAEPEPVPGERAAGTAPLLEVRHLVNAPRVRDVSFVLRRGEILGLGGVVGSGRTEVARMIFGADRMEGGEMLLNGRPFAPSSTMDAIAAGVALVPEERRSQALIMDESVSSNINMGGWNSNRIVSWLPFVSTSKADQRTLDMGSRLSIKMRDQKVPVRTLSGGNQQKVVFGRWLARSSTVMLLDEPTRGVDVGARRQIWQTVEDFAAAGNSVIVICSELEEMSVCHRIIVLVEGRSIAELDGPGIAESEILETIYATENHRY